MGFKKVSRFQGKFHSSIVHKNIIIQKLLKFTRQNLKGKSMQSGALHIASSLFSIFYKVTSMSEYVDQIWLPHRESFVKRWKIMQGTLAGKFLWILCKILSEFVRVLVAFSERQQSN